MEIHYKDGKPILKDGSNNQTNNDPITNSYTMNDFIQQSNKVDLADYADCMAGTAIMLKTILDSNHSQKEEFVGALGSQTALLGRALKTLDSANNEIIAAKFNANLKTLSSLPVQAKIELGQKYSATCSKPSINKLIKIGISLNLHKVTP